LPNKITIKIVYMERISMLLVVISCLILTISMTLDGRVAMAANIIAILVAIVALFFAIKNEVNKRNKG
jgi:uncharacterized Tic20 family protein